MFIIYYYTVFNLFKNVIFYEDLFEIYFLSKWKQSKMCKFEIR